MYGVDSASTSNGTATFGSDVGVFDLPAMAVLCKGG